MRVFLSVLAGFLLWSVLWVGAHQAALAARPGSYDPAGIPTERALFFGYLGWSLVCSLAAGWLARRLTGATRPVLILGLLLLAFGLVVQASVWEREPLAYHLAFLGLLVPVCVLGGRLARRRTA